MIDISNAFRPQTTHTISASTSSAASSAFNAQTTTVMVTTTGACFVEFSAAPTATSASTYIVADTPYIFTALGGGKAAAIMASGTATVYVTELSR